jgi:DNA-binding response OmpR family regulator
MEARKFNIHVFSPKHNICSLIKKFLENDRYKISCTNTGEINENLPFKNYGEVDCVIIDRSLEIKSKENLKNHFKGIPMICLPSLNEDISIDTGIKYINEPLRMSELGRMLNEIFQ